MMIHRPHLLTQPNWTRHLPALLMAACLLSSCALQGTGGNAASVTSDATALPPGGLGPGAIISAATTGAVATPTSAPIVPVATVAQVAATPVPPTAVSAPPTDIPLPPTDVPAATPRATVQSKATAAPTVRATATARVAASPSPAATAVRTAEPKATPHMVAYTVQKGDDVYAIARHFSVTPAAIITANDLKNPSQIKIGQVLQIPVNGAGGRTPTA